MIHVGTSGFSYRDWVGVYYPPELPASQRLAFYGAEFSAVEINSSYYRPPTAASLLAISKRAPEGLVFTVKAPGAITHQREDLAANCRALVDALQPGASSSGWAVCWPSFLRLWQYACQPGLYGPWPNTSPGCPR